MNDQTQFILDEAKARYAKSQEHYFEFTKNTSIVARSLAFAEGGVFWLLKDSLKGHGAILWLGLFFLILFFISDFLQYYRGMVDYKKLLMRMRSEIDSKTITKKSSSNEQAKKASDRYFFLKNYFISASSILLMVCFYYSNLLTFN